MMYKSSRIRILIVIFLFLTYLTYILSSQQTPLEIVISIGWPSVRILPNKNDWQSFRMPNQPGYIVKAGFYTCEKGIINYKIIRENGEEYLFTVEKKGEGCGLALGNVYVPFNPGEVIKLQMISPGYVWLANKDVYIEGRSSRSKYDIVSKIVLKIGVPVEIEFKGIVTEKESIEGKEWFKVRITDVPSEKEPVKEDEIIIVYAENKDANVDSSIKINDCVEVKGLYAYLDKWKKFGVKLSETSHYIIKINCPLRASVWTEDLSGIKKDTFMPGERLKICFSVNKPATANLYVDVYPEAGGFRRVYLFRGRVPAGKLCRASIVGEVGRRVVNLLVDSLKVQHEYTVVAQPQPPQPPPPPQPLQFKTHVYIEVIRGEVYVKVAFSPIGISWWSFKSLYYTYNKDNYHRELRNIAGYMFSTSYVVIEEGVDDHLQEVYSKVKVDIRNSPYYSPGVIGFIDPLRNKGTGWLDYVIVKTYDVTIVRCDPLPDRLELNLAEWNNAFWAEAPSFYRVYLTLPISYLVKGNIPIKSYTTNEVVYEATYELYGPRNVRPGTKQEYTLIIKLPVFPKAYYYPYYPWKLKGAVYIAYSDKKASLLDSRSYALDSLGKEWGIVPTYSLEWRELTERILNTLSTNIVANIGNIINEKYVKLPKQFTNDKVYDIKAIGLITEKRYELSGVKLILPFEFEKDVAGSMKLHLYLELYMYEGERLTPSYYIQYYFSARINIS